MALQAAETNFAAADNQNARADYCSTCSAETFSQLQILPKSCGFKTGCFLQATQLQAPFLCLVTKTVAPAAKIGTSMDRALLPGRSLLTFLGLR